MQTPNFVPVQFFDAAGLNQQTKTLFGSITSPLSLLFSPGLINPQDMQVSTSGLQVTVDLPAPFAILTNTGIVAQAHGVVDNADTQSYEVDLTSLVPATGSVTAYIIASLTSIYQDPFIVTGPPAGHPDYDPTFQPSQQQATKQYSIAVSAATAAPNNMDAFILGQYTLSAGQTTLPAIDTAMQMATGVAVMMSMAALNTIRIPAFYAGTLPANTTLLLATLPYQVTFGGNFAPSVLSCLTAPSVQCSFSVLYYPAGSSTAQTIGTITVNAGSQSGSFSGNAMTMNAGDRVAVVGPNADSGIADVSLSLVAAIYTGQAM